MILDGRDPESISRAVAALRSGDVVGMPTETVYGLAADATNPVAVRRIFTLKGRPADHPVIVHLGSADQLDRWARHIPPVAVALIERFWPGPLTLILPAADAVLPEVTGRQPTVGLRMPSHPVALALLRDFGAGLAAPSANRFGRVSPTQAAHVAAEFGAEVGIVLDGGACEVGLESTILDLSDLGRPGGRPRLLRPGAITPAALAEVIGELPQGVQRDAPRVPGSLEAHYAPQTPLILVPATALADTVARARADGQRVAVLAMQADCREPRTEAWQVMPAGPEAYAHDLYASLRAADRLGCAVILLEQPPDTPAWQAINDRLRRAACGSTASGGG